MIELPEARTIAKDLRKEIVGKEIVDVLGNFTDHKFTFYYDDPTKYKEQLVGKIITGVTDRNFYVEIEIDDYKLIMRDGANIRYYNNQDKLPAKSKLLLVFNDGSCFNVTTSMYCFICVLNKNENYDNKYYELELAGIGALDDKFTFEYFQSLLNDTTLKLSLKAFLATEQRILGIGNGVVQDILFNAKLHPKRKMKTLSEEDILGLYNAVRTTLTEMVAKGARDTEKNIYGENGGYKTILSSKNYKANCPVCKGAITKENYLGGSIYYCDFCQK